MDVLACTLCVTFIVMAVWVMLASFALTAVQYYEHSVEYQARMMEKFAGTTNYPMYQKYQEKVVVSAARLNKANRFLHFITFS